MQHGGTTAVAAARYAGADRRQSRSAPRRSISISEIGMFLAALWCVGLVVPTLLDRLPSFTTAVHAQAALRTTWSVLFACAGIVRLIRWRLTGEARAALLGAGMVCFGLISAPTSALAPVLQQGDLDVLLSPVTRVVAVAVFQALLLRAMMAPFVQATIRPLRTITRALLGALTILGIVLVAEHLVAPIHFPPDFWFVVETCQAGAWFAFAGAALFSGFHRQDASTTWIGLGLVILATAQLLHGIAFVQPHASAFYATCLQVVAAGLAMTNSAVDLSHVLSADGNRMLSLSSALHDAESTLSEEEDLQAERLHDARSVIAALKAASITLDRYDERLEPAVKHKLRSSLVTELTRLEQVIEGRQQEPLRAFRLSAALDPLLAAERENKLVIKAELGDIAVVGRPLELATVVQNLLVNARRYAKGSAVHIKATQDREHVQILVQDHGPGVDPTQHELVFERGYRGQSDEDGSGLGLYLARRLMREQGGEVVVRNRTGRGACFVLTLRAPSWGQKIEDGPEVLKPANGQVDTEPVTSDRPALPRLPRQRDHDTSDVGTRRVVRHDEVNQQSFVGPPDPQAT